MIPIATTFSVPVPVLLSRPDCLAPNSGSDSADNPQPSIDPSRFRFSSRFRSRKRLDTVLPRNYSWYPRYPAITGAASRGSDAEGVGVRKRVTANIQGINQYVARGADRGAFIFHIALVAGRSELWDGFRNVVEIFVIIEGQMNMRATRALVVNAPHGHSHLQRSHECISRFLITNKIFDGKRSKLIERRGG
ncbi:hypothetical protein EVAR_80473_1 [Eumeta japonica]|uniref:Uncharacterized protein n=1 Tax=Eumeta variegata TaxID=151549 RepID=A0A4C1YQJ2_EUMVA|nr:hypothetical protein EVAR_80473_1 [Eumeta japonica]